MCQLGLCPVVDTVQLQLLLYWRLKVVQCGAVTPKHEVNQEAEHEIWYQ